MTIKTLFKETYKELKELKYPTRKEGAILFLYTLGITFVVAVIVVIFDFLIRIPVSNILQIDFNLPNNNILTFIIIIFSVIGIFSILKQNRSEGLGEIFGGKAENYKKRDLKQNILMGITFFSAIVIIITSLVV